MTLRRMEAQGDIRGGRFVSGFVGEQFARPEAVELLREIRRDQNVGAAPLVSAADPLNLAGIITPGPRVSPLSGNGRPLWEDRGRRKMEPAVRVPALVMPHLLPKPSGVKVGSNSVGCGDFLFSR